MPNLELNKLIAAILVASIIGMIIGFVGDSLYDTEHVVEKRGYQVAVQEESAATPEVKEEEKFDIQELLKTADAERGAKVFAKCAACHDISKGGVNKVGPNLFAVVGAKHAHMSTYSYSAAMKASVAVWSEEELAQFLHNPKKYIPGTKMSFIGLAKPQDIADVIKFLKSNE